MRHRWDLLQAWQPVVFLPTKGPVLETKETPAWDQWEANLCSDSKVKLMLEVLLTSVPQVF